MAQMVCGGQWGIIGGQGVSSGGQWSQGVSKGQGCQ